MRLWMALLMVGAWAAGTVIADECSRLFAVPRPTFQTGPGPFYPLEDFSPRGNDLTSPGVRGERLHLEGVVRDETGHPIVQARVELWQACESGRYRDARDRSSGELDPAFLGFGLCQASADGAYQFETIVPGGYPTGPTTRRTPHLHFKISAPGFVTVFTELYFAGEAWAGDPVAKRLAAPDREQMTLHPEKRPEDGDGKLRARADFVLVTASARQTDL